MSTIEAEMTTPSSPKTKRRATAETMAKSQREISVSEFFAKNRHLLGFDNPRKALLTTIKEAVDNSLDACEEAGIVPEIWVHVEQTGANRYKAGIQDNGPGIMKKQIPLIFGKLLYGSKFHRLRMSRGQQGIGISAAGMYGLLTTGKPVKIVSKVSIRKPAHYYELRINTKTNDPEILDGIDIDAGEKGHKYIADHGIEWVTHYDPKTPDAKPAELRSGTRVTIELEAKYQRGRGSVDEYLEQTAIANPHVTIHYLDPENNLRLYSRSTRKLPPEPVEIKPHPYGVEVGRLITMLKETPETTISGFLTNSFSRVSNGIAKQICEGAKIGTRTHGKKLTRDDIEKLYHAIQATKISNPSTDCIVPIGEELLLKGMHQVVPAEFYCAATRPPSVYRGNPFLIEVALAYGGAVETTKITKDLLKELLSESDARTVRQFLINTFNGLGADAADKITKASKMGARKSPGKLKPREIDALFDAMQNVNVNEGQSMNVLRYANRVPLQFSQAGCAITQSITSMNWRSYGLSQSRGNVPSGPVTLMVHMASVWVPFTSESKEAVASYPEIQKELRLGLQAVGRKLGMFLRKRQLVKQQADRRSIFLRYLGEVATAVSELNGCDRQSVYDNLMAVAQKKTAEADMKLNTSGKLVDETEDFGDNVLIVEKTTEELLNRPNSNGEPEDDAPLNDGSDEAFDELEDE
ncbi:DNA topoisomerase VI subunit B [Blastopirellula sp. J2-11]|uniref:DNA topoisomerase VI subunit B n=1 Tax=Blastopirellula sp. J2-11 TaxID=2943192 RepID=UPI0021C9C68A|nr:DNA topoisomerase VI subunit B [Blastopirellula sp. J2-11]UUO06398.1 DNA topoisomerase VI subunit B [Blastopirellula sp. J2-11]